jgi:hypothetical protein
MMNDFFNKFEQLLDNRYRVTKALIVTLFAFAIIVFLYALGYAIGYLTTTFIMGVLVPIFGPLLSAIAFCFVIVWISVYFFMEFDSK